MELVLAEHLERTYRKEHHNLLKFIRSKISDYEDAEDILQDVFFQAVRNLNVTQPIENLLAWLYTSTRNKIIDLYRKEKFRRYFRKEEEEGDAKESPDQV